MDDVMAFDPNRTTNLQLMIDCAQLGYLVDPLIDVTYGNGWFWKGEFQPLLKYDLHPKQPTVIKADFRDLPLDDGSVATVVFDPPYKLNGTSTGVGPSALDESYGAAGAYRPAHVVQESYQAGINEAGRVLRVGGMLLVKSQAQQSSGKLNDQPEAWIIAYAVKRRWHVVTKLHVYDPKPRTQAHRGKQRTARQNYSTLVVLRRRASTRV